MKNAKLQFKILKKNRFVLIILFLAITLILTGCITSPFRKAEISKEPKPEAGCIQDSDCDIGGCSGEICGPKDKVKDIITACVYLPEYECLKKTSCRCIDGKCQWEKAEELKECMEKYDREPGDFDLED